MADGRADAPRGEGRAVFEPSDDGLFLRVTDETGLQLDDERTMGMRRLCGAGVRKRLSRSIRSAGGIDIMAETFGKRLYRIGRDDGDARRLWSSQIFMRDAVHRAAYLASYTAAHGMSVAQLAEKAPKFHTEYREIPLSSNRARFMRAISDTLGEASPEYGRGMRVHIDGGWFTIAPSARAWCPCAFAQRAAPQNLPMSCVTASASASGSLTAI